MKTVTAPVLELNQNGVRLLLTTMKAGDLHLYTKVEPFDGKKELSDPTQGYQRPPEAMRIRKLGNWLKKETEGGGKVMMPTAILLSGRGADLTRNADGTITFRESNKLSIIDGQHRRYGFDYAINDKGVRDLAEFDVPVVILTDVSKQTEMEQFRVVNGTAKSVRTDLVNMILAHLQGLEGDDAIPEKDAWKVVVSHVVKQLNEAEGGPWYDKIVMPDGKAYAKEEVSADPKLRHQRIARATSFMQSLKGLDQYLNANHLGEIGTIEERTTILYTVVSEYWNAVRQLCPDCFDNADDYVLQKTPGIFSMHALCLRMLPQMHNGRREFIESDFRIMLGDSVEISDPEFWYVGNADGRSRGVAAQYGSMKGFSELARQLEGGLQP